MAVQAGCMADTGKVKIVLAVAEVGACSRCVVDTEKIQTALSAAEVGNCSLAVIDMVLDSRIVSL